MSLAEVPDRSARPARNPNSQRVQYYSSDYEYANLSDESDSEKPTARPSGSGSTQAEPIRHTTSSSAHPTASGLATLGKVASPFPRS